MVLMLCIIFSYFLFCNLQLFFHRSTLAQVYQTFIVMVTRINMDKVIKWSWIEETMLTTGFAQETELYFLHPQVQGSTMVRVM